jgi:hypothetical protein
MSSAVLDIAIAAKQFGAVPVMRDVALALNADARIGAYAVDVENFESIHNHSAYARIERA